MIEYNISEKEIAKSDFNSIVEVQNLKSYTEEHVNGFKQAQKDLMYKAEVEVLSDEEECQMELFKAEIDTLKSIQVVNDDLTRETLYYRSNDSLTKSQEIEKGFKEEQILKEQEQFDTILKGFEAGFIDEDTFEKAVGHKYFKREAKAGGGYKYYYTEAQYKKEKGGEGKKDGISESDIQATVDSYIADVKSGKYRNYQDAAEDVAKIAMTMGKGEASEAAIEVGVRLKRLQNSGKQSESKQEKKHEGDSTFKVGSKYDRDSGMGGKLTFRFLGEKNGKLNFKNTMHKDYGGGLTESYTKEQAKKEFEFYKN